MHSHMQQPAYEGNLLGEGVHTQAVKQHTRGTKEVANRNEVSVQGETTNNKGRGTQRQRENKPACERNTHTGSKYAFKGGSGHTQT
jgi:hypothetical protein